MTRTPPPGLAIETPLCSMCLRPTDATPDGLECPDCDAWWSYSTPEGAGEWNAPDADQCAATAQPFLRATKVPEEIRTTTVRCLLEQDHGVDEHRSEDHKWTTAVEDGAAA